MILMTVDRKTSCNRILCNETLCINIYTVFEGKRKHIYKLLELRFLGVR